MPQGRKPDDFCAEIKDEWTQKEDWRERGELGLGLRAQLTWAFEKLLLAFRSQRFLKSSGGNLSLGNPGTGTQMGGTGLR